MDRAAVTVALRYVAHAGNPNMDTRLRRAAWKAAKRLMKLARVAEDKK